ncbi:DUF6248 family natural product biosynthesis protein [Kitasatospora sp. NPDC059646]|uniref:DUF6248 family natural product biosynthesis protein n=1 Tax=Kitasatospora sp. NPDC059646 TaxID=3346893 RepID=UPI003683E0E4
MKHHQDQDPAAGPVIRRPQRTLTPEEIDRVNSARLLNLHGALIMGIVDPVPNPSPMSEAEGAWVREHVWPRHYQVIEAKYPNGFRRWSLCERGTCWNCLNGQCHLCIHRQKGRPDADDNLDSIDNLRGRSVARLILRPDGAPCLWWCRCPCEKTGPIDPGGPVEAEPDGRTDDSAGAGRRRARAAEPVHQAQGALF